MCAVAIGLVAADVPPVLCSCIEECEKPPHLYKFNTHVSGPDLGTAGFHPGASVQGPLHLYFEIAIAA